MSFVANWRWMYVSYDNHVVPDDTKQLLPEPLLTKTSDGFIIA